MTWVLYPFKYVCFPPSIKIQDLAVIIFYYIFNYISSILALKIIVLGNYILRLFKYRDNNNRYKHIAISSYTLMDYPIMANQLLGKVQVIYIIPSATYFLLN